MTFAYSLRMRLLTPLVAVALVVLLAACRPDPVPAPLPPEPTATPVFASDAEALAAAEEAYAAYLEISGQISDAAGANPERIAEFVTESYRSRATESFAVYSQGAIRTSGTTTADSFDLVFFDDSELQIEACVDVSESRVLDEMGVDRTPDDRVERVGLRILFRIEAGRLLVADSDVARTKEC